MCRRALVYTAYTRGNEGVVQPGVVPKEVRHASRVHTLCQSQAVSRVHTLCQSQAERVCTPQNRATVTVRPRLSQADCDCVCPPASICPDSGQLYGKLFSWFSYLRIPLTRSDAVELGALGNGVLFHAVTCEQPPTGYVRVSVVIWF